MSPTRRIIYIDPLLKICIIGSVLINLLGLIMVFCFAKANHINHEISLFGMLISVGLWMLLNFVISAVLWANVKLGTNRQSLQIVVKVYFVVALAAFIVELRLAWDMFLGGGALMYKPSATAVLLTGFICVVANFVLSFVMLALSLKRHAPDVAAGV